MKVYPAFIIVLLLTGCVPARPCEATPRALRGVVDLRSWNFEENGPVDLSGDWEFFWNRLVLPSRESGPVFSSDGYIQVPGIWNGRVVDGVALGGDGYATYRLNILLPGQGSQGSEALGIMLRDIGTAYTLFIDGRMVASGGSVGVTSSSSLPGYRPGIAEFPAGSPGVEIILHVSNFHHRKGGVWERICIGTAARLRDMRDRRAAIDFFLFGSLVMMGGYSLILFGLRKRERSHLSFGVFCIIIAIRILVTGQYHLIRLWPGSPWELVLKLEYLTFYAAVPSFIMFMRTQFGDEFDGRIAAATLFIGCAFGGAVILLPSRWYTWTMQPYQVLSTIAGIYCMAVIIRAAANKREGALPLLAGFAVLFGTVVNDFLYSNLALRTGYFVPFGLVVFIFSQAVLLSIRFSQAVRAVEGLSKELAVKNERLKELDIMKDEFLASVSHELNAPLAGMIGLAESMIEHDRGTLDEGSRQQLQLIGSSGRRLAGLVKDLMDFTRLKTRDFFFARVPVDVRTLADVVIALSRPLAGSKPLRFVNAVPPGLPPVLADESRILQVLHNLIGNAIDCTDEGSITLSASLSGTSGGLGWMEISVSDTGIGMDPVCMARLFDRGDGIQDVEGARGGPGMGFAIARRIVDLHGGEIRVRTAPGYGTIVTFTLPLCEVGGLPVILPDTAGTGSARRCRQAAASARGRVLVVDDDAVSVAVIRNYLSAEGFTAAAADDGAAALAAIGREPFDAILMDIMMPSISGLELCGEIRRRFSLHELPIIILTNLHGVEDLVAAFSAGANDYLAKPIHREELLARVGTLVALKKTVRENAEAKFRLLQERMSPHYLFNALNTVHALVRKDPSEADRAVMLLADNYRFIIEHSFSSLIPFDEEWRFVESYLAFEGLRFRDSLTSRMTREGDFSDVRIPPLIIQPLVENALKHGLRNRHGQGTVAVRAEAGGGRLLVSVEDNGNEFQSEDLSSRSLGNIRNRLSHYFNEVSLAVEALEEGGVAVRISLARAGVAAGARQGWHDE